MNRKDFIRNTLLALCTTLLPKNLLPSTGETKVFNKGIIWYINYDELERITFCTNSFTKQQMEEWVNKLQKSMWGIPYTS